MVTETCPQCLIILDDNGNCHHCLADVFGACIICGDAMTDEGLLNDDDICEICATEKSEAAERNKRRENNKKQKEWQGYQNALNNSIAFSGTRTAGLTRWSKELNEHLLTIGALTEGFEELRNMHSGEPVCDFTDYAEEVLQNDARVIETRSAFGPAGQFEINILEYNGVYFVQAPEFEDQGYFLDIEQARIAMNDIAERIT